MDRQNISEIEYDKAYYNEFVSNFEANFEEENSKKDDNKGVLFVVVKKEKVDSDEEFIENDKRKDTWEEKKEYGIKVKNKIDEKIDSEVQKIGCRLVLILYCIGFIILMRDKFIYKCIGLGIMIAILLEITFTLKGLFDEKKKLKMLMIYFEDEIFISRKDTSFLTEIRNDFEKVLVKAKKMNQICEMEYYLEYRIIKLKDGVMGVLGIIVFLSLLSFIGWSCLFFIKMHQLASLLVWLVLITLMLVESNFIKDYLRNKKKIKLLSKEQKLREKMSKTNNLGREQQKMARQDIRYDFGQKRIEAIINDDILTEEVYAKNEMKHLKKSRSEHELETSIISIILIIVASIMLYMDMKKIGGSIMGIVAVVVIVFIAVVIYKNTSYRLKMQILEKMTRKI